MKQTGSALCHQFQKLKLSKAQEGAEGDQQQKANRLLVAID
uniref:Uncharacterized protein n=1 Tax=Tetranychus urticae TaxID=32264 RepID=T1L306_TETUR